MNPRFLIGAIGIAAIIATVWLYTSWHRNNATQIAESAAVATTVETTDKAEGLKNEVRKRPVSDDVTTRRLLSGTW
jgi:hypothetical protein